MILFHSLTLCFPFNIFIIYFWPCHVACGILVPEPGMEPVLPAVEAESYHWTSRDSHPSTFLLNFKRHIKIFSRTSGGPLVKNPHFHCRGCRFDPWPGN